MVEGPNTSQDEPTQIVINDPVEGVNYFLNPRNHSGTRNVFRTFVPPQQPPKLSLPLISSLPHGQCAAASTAGIEGAIHLRGHPNPANEGQLKTGQREGPGH